MFGLGALELILLLVLIILLFGVGRISKIGKELGSAKNIFKRGLNKGEIEEKPRNDVKPKPKPKPKTKPTRGLFRKKTGAS